MPITITVPSEKLEEVAFQTGALIEYGAVDARADVSTEGGVTLRLVAPLGVAHV